jgi:lysozyme family protein
MEFKRAIEHVLKHEGGYSYHKDDRGGETIYGITVKVAKANGYLGRMRIMPREIALEIYEKEYWLKGKCNMLPEHIRYMHLDACVNHGVGGAAKILQREIGVTADGDIGPQTLGEVQKATIDGLTYERLRYYARIVSRNKSQSVFLKGWINRAIEVEKTSKEYYENDCN